MPDLQRYVIEKTDSNNNCFGKRFIFSIFDHSSLLTIWTDLISNSFVLPELNNGYLFVPSVKSTDESTDNVQFVVVETERTVTETSEDAIGRVDSGPTQVLTVEQPHVSQDLSLDSSFKTNASDYHEILAV